MRKLGFPIEFPAAACKNAPMATAEERQKKREADRAKRLGAALRTNLQKRKEQVRARRAGDEDERSGLPAAKSENSSQT